MASDSLISVIGGLIRRENRMAREEKAKLKASEAEAVEDEEEDEDEEPVGEPSDNQPPADEPPPEGEPEAEPEPEDEEEPNPEGDTKPTGPDPTLVAQVAAIIKKELDDDAKEKEESEVKLSGKKEKINTKPKLEQEVRKGKMNFREAVRMSVTGTHLAEGYEDVVLGILEDENIDGPLGYEPFFEKGKLYVEKGSEKKAEKALKQSREVNKVPKIVGEELSEEEYLQMEAVSVDGRLRGFKEALKRLTYEKIKAIMKKEGVEVPEGLSSEGAAEFMAAASAAKREGKKKFKFGGKEYPVTIKVDIPTKKEEVEIEEGAAPPGKPDEPDPDFEDMFYEAYDSLDESEQLEIDTLFDLFEDEKITEDEVIEGLADLITKSGRQKRKLAKLQKGKAKADAAAEREKEIQALEKEKAQTDAEKEDKKRQKKKDKAAKKERNKGKGVLAKIGKGLKKVFGPSKDEPVSQADAQKAVDDGKRAPAGWKKDETGKVVKSESVEESIELQAIMALDDAGVKADINRKGQVVIKKKDKKKAHRALEKSFKKGGWPTLKLEDGTNALVDQYKKDTPGQGNELDEGKKERIKAADELKALADKGGADAPALFSLASKLRGGPGKGSLTTGLKVSKKVAAIFKKYGIKEEVQKKRTAYEVVSEARNRAKENKPEWDNEDSRLS